MANSHNDSKIMKISAPKVDKVNVSNNVKSSAPSGKSMVDDLLEEIGIGGKATNSSSA